jgi:hypothetical protein
MRTDKIGKSYCLNEIRLSGKRARLVEDSAEKSWNMEVLDEEHNHIIHVQVDSIDWEIEAHTPVKIHFINKALDYLIIVLLNYKGEEFTSYVIPQNKLKQKGKGDTFKLIDEAQLVYYASRPNPSESSYQTIDISTLKHDDIQQKFECYKSAFKLIVKQ